MRWRAVDEPIVPPPPTMTTFVLARSGMLRALSWLGLVVQKVFRIE
jgi:hypothetical protein